MNKRARNRLIIVTATIVVAVTSVFVFVWLFFGARPVTVEQAATDASLVGTRVTVSGSVVAGSWDQKTNPMRFEIRDENADQGPTVKVVFTGGMPSTFGDGVGVDVTGVLGDNATVESNSMTTKCPSKYETASDALSVSTLLKAGSKMEGVTTKVTGTVQAGSIQAPGSDPRFVIADTTGESLAISFDGGLPTEVVDGAEVVVQGAVEPDGRFVATSVSLAQK